MVAVMVAVAEGLFDFVGVDCAEASDSSRFTAQPHRLPPSSITNRVNLAVIIGGTDYVPPRPLDSGVGTTFMHCQESIYRFAQAMGETGPQLTDAAGVPGNGANGYSAPFVKYSYRNGQVVYYKLVGGTHGLAVNGSTVYATEANQLIASFLLQ